MAYENTRDGILCPQAWIVVSISPDMRRGYKSIKGFFPLSLFGAHWSVSFSLLGQCQFCEPTGLANPADIFHVNPVGPLLMTFDVSASKQALAFGDSEGCVHLWTDSPEPSFNPYSRETEFALPCLVDSLPPLDWSQDLLPLSLIPVPLTTDTLLSDWPAANSAPAPRLYLTTRPEGGRGPREIEASVSPVTSPLLWLFLSALNALPPSEPMSWEMHVAIMSCRALELYWLIGGHHLWMQRFFGP